MTQTDAHDVRPTDMVSALMRRIDKYAFGALDPDVRIPDELALGLLDGDTRYALFAVAHTDSPAVLAAAAHHQELKVQQAVASCVQIDDATVAYLWQVAGARGSWPMLASLADRVPVADLAELWLGRGTWEGTVNAPSPAIRHRRVASMLARRPIDELCEAVEQVADRTATPDRQLEELTLWVTRALCDGRRVDRSLPADLVRLYEAVPADRRQARRNVLVTIAERGPVDATTLELLATAGSSKTYEVRVVGSMDRRRVDDTTIIGLLESAPERLELFEIGFREAAPARPAAHMGLAEFLLINAARFPGRVLPVLAGKLVPVDCLEPTLIETAVRALPDEYLAGVDRGFWPDRLLPTVTLAPDVVVKLLRYQIASWYRSVYPISEWLGGGYPANPPTVETFAALLEEPGSAFGLLTDSSEQYVTGRLVNNAEALKHLGTIPGMLDLVLAAAGSGWTLLLADDTVAAHVASRLVETVQLSPDNVTQMLALVECSRAGYETTMRTIQRMA